MVAVRRIPLRVWTFATFTNLALNDLSGEILDGRMKVAEERTNLPDIGRVRRLSCGEGCKHTKGGAGPLVGMRHGLRDHSSRGVDGGRVEMRHPAGRQLSPSDG